MKYKENENITRIKEAEAYLKNLKPDEWYSLRLVPDHLWEGVWNIIDTNSHYIINEFSNYFKKVI